VDLLTFRTFSGDYYAFGNGFETIYDNGGKQAGTYTRSNTDSTNWTRK
jgi:hypothetical protein